MCTCKTISFAGRKTASSLGDDSHDGKAVIDNGIVWEAACVRV